MKTKILLLSNIIFLICLNGLQAYELDFHGRVSNSVYAFEDIKTHVRLYQRLHLSADIPYLKTKFNTSFRAFTDLDSSFTAEKRYNVYALNIEARQLSGNRLDLTLGRQFLHPGTVLGALDGIKLGLHVIPAIFVTLYGGVESHLLRATKIYKIDEALVGGGMVEYRDKSHTLFQLLYLQKNTKEKTYWQLTGLNFTNNSLPNTTIQLQSHYDLLNARCHRLYLNFIYRKSNRFLFSLAFKNQYPQIYASSFYTIFEPEPYQHFTISASQKITGSFFMNGFFQFLQTEGANANRILFSVNNNNGNIGLIYESGDLGEQTGVIADYGLELLPNLLASINVDYSRYKVEKVYEFDRQLANATRLSYRFWHHWMVDLEYQWLTNRYKDSDSRILIQIHFSW